MPTFDPSLLPAPRVLRQIRSQQTKVPRPLRTAEWYCPMLLFGQPGTVLVTGKVGIIPVIWDCTPIGWTLSSNVTGTITIRLTYADYTNTPAYPYPTLSTQNAP